LADNAPLNYLVFQSFDFERTWWRLFQKYVVSCELNLISTFLLLNSDKILLHNAQAKQQSNSTCTVNIIFDLTVTVRLTRSSETTIKFNMNSQYNIWPHSDCKINKIKKIKKYPPSVLIYFSVFCFLAHLAIGHVSFCHG
jgi:hypothetical protein